MLLFVRPLFLLLLLALPSCTAWNRSAGSTHYSTPFPFLKPSLTAPPSTESLPTGGPLTPEAPDEVLDPPATPSPEPRPVQVRLPASVQKTKANRVTLTLVLFDDREMSLALADQEGGPGGGWKSAQAAANAHRALAAINGGFFGANGEPLGLVIENGRRFGSWNSSSSLTSGALVIDASGPRLLRRQRWRSSAPARHLLQSGPFLLENGAVVSGLSNQRARPRSFLAWDGRHHWALGYAGSATLRSLATALASQPIPGERFTTALNLDGGTSSDLWVGSALRGGPVTHRTFWNKPVRNYVLLQRRDQTP